MSFTEPPPGAGSAAVITDPPSSSSATSETALHTRLVQPGDIIGLDIRAPIGHENRTGWIVAFVDKGTPHLIEPAARAGEVRNHINHLQTLHAKGHLLARWPSQEDAQRLYAHIIAQGLAEKTGMAPPVGQDYLLAAGPKPTRVAYSALTLPYPGTRIFAFNAESGLQEVPHMDSRNALDVRTLAPAPELRGLQTLPPSPSEPH